MQRLAHPEGEAATARAAARHGVCMGLSSLSTVSLEKVAQAGGPQGLRWFQLYVFKDRDVTRRYFPSHRQREKGIGMKRE